MVRSAAADLRREWRLAITDPSLPATLVITGCLTLLALLAGWLRTGQRLEREQALARENSQQRRFLESAFEESTWTDSSESELTPAEQDRQLLLQMSARSPDLMRFTDGVWRSILPATPLSGLSTGASGDWPDHYRHAGPSKSQTLTRAMQPNPLLAAVGAFDLTLLVGAILPLAAIVLTYNVAAADREQGRWELVQSHASSISRLVISRCVVRVGLLAAVVITLTALSTLVFPTGRWDVATFRNLLIWSGGVSAYLAVWCALAVLVNSYRLSSAGAGLLLLVCWCLLVVAVPSLLERGINARLQMPPNSELASMEAEVRKQAEKEADETWAEFLRQHPGIEIDDENPQQEQLLRDIALEEAIRSGTNKRFEEYYRQFLDREDLLDQAQLLTPLLAWRTIADQAAGTSLRHFVEFARQTAVFHDDYISSFEPMSLAGRELSLSDIQAIPRFDSGELPVRLDHLSLLLSAASLLVWGGMCGLLSWRRFRRDARQ